MALLLLPFLWKPLDGEPVRFVDFGTLLLLWITLCEFLEGRHVNGFGLEVEPPSIPMVP